MAGWQPGWRLNWMASCRDGETRLESWLADSLAGWLRQFSRKLDLQGIVYRWSLLLTASRRASSLIGAPVESHVHILGKWHQIRPDWRCYFGFVDLT